MAGLEIQQIMERLPHRYPLLLLDRVLELEPGRRIAALKNVTINERYFQGHFPGLPVMPGVLILEAMAQAAGLLVFSAETPAGHTDGSVYYYVGIDNARFKKPVTAGDTLRLNVALERTVRGIWKFKAEARVEDALVAEAELMCTVRSLKEEPAA